MYGYSVSNIHESNIVCNLMSNDKELVVNKIYENETDKIIGNAIWFSLILSSGLLGSIYFLFELKK